MDRKERGISSTIVVVVILIAIASVGATVYITMRPESEPAKFEVSNLSLSPSQVKPGESVTISVDVSNIGEQTGDNTVELKIDGTVENSKIVTLDGGKSTTVTFTVKRETKKSYSVEIGNLSDSFEVVAPAEFEVSNLTISPSEVKPGESVTVSVEVKNTGGIEGTKAVKLIVGASGGIVPPMSKKSPEETKNVTVGGGKTETVSFSIEKEKKKLYPVRIGNQTGIFGVRPPLFDVVKTESLWSVSKNLNLDIYESSHFLSGGGNHLFFSFENSSSFSGGIFSMNTSTHAFDWSKEGQGSHYSSPIDSMDINGDGVVDLIVTRFTEFGHSFFTVYDGSNGEKLLNIDSPSFDISDYQIIDSNKVKILSSGESSYETLHLNLLNGEISNRTSVDINTKEDYSVYTSFFHDIDDDSQSEVFSVTNKGGGIVGGGKYRLQLYDSASREWVSYLGEVGSGGYRHHQLVDINEDGFKDIITVWNHSPVEKAKHPGHIIVNSGKTGEIIVRKDFDKLAIYGIMDLIDLNEDGTPELLANVGDDSGAGYVQKIDGFVAFDFVSGEYNYIFNTGGAGGRRIQGTRDPKIFIAKRRNWKATHFLNLSQLDYLNLPNEDIPFMHDNRIPISSLTTFLGRENYKGIWIGGLSGIEGYVSTSAFTDVSGDGFPDIVRGFLETSGKIGVQVVKVEISTR